MSQRRVRSVAFADAQIHVEALGDDAARLVSLMFRDMDTPAQPALGPLFQIERDAQGMWTVGTGARRYYTGPDAGDAAVALQDVTSEALAGACRNGLVLHAAAVAKGQLAVVLPGKTGAGKTTLTAHLVRRGFRYLTDEMTYLPFDSSLVGGFPRPLGLKVSGRGLVDTERWEVLPGSSTTLVLPEPAPPAGTPETGLGVIVFPRFAAGAAVSAVRLTAAATAMRLMGNLLNARNLDGHGFPEVTAAARRTSGFDLTFGDASEAADEVCGILESLGDLPAQTDSV